MCLLRVISFLFSHNTKTTSWLDPRLAKKAKPPEECKENGRLLSFRCCSEGICLCVCVCLSQFLQKSGIWGNDERCLIAALVRSHKWYQFSVCHVFLLFIPLSDAIQSWGSQVCFLPVVCVTPGLTLSLISYRELWSAEQNPFSDSELLIYRRFNA